MKASLKRVEMHVFSGQTSVKQNGDEQNVAEAGTDGLEDNPERRLLSENPNTRQDRMLKWEETML